MEKAYSLIVEKIHWNLWIKYQCWSICIDSSYIVSLLIKSTKITRIIIQLQRYLYWRYVINKKRNLESANSVSKFINKIFNLPNAWLSWLEVITSRTTATITIYLTFCNQYKQHQCCTPAPKYLFKANN